MGTRNLTCVVKDKKFKVAQYCQWDGYPEGQGADIVKFLKEEFDPEVFNEKLDTLVSFGTTDDLEKQWVEVGAKKGEGFVSLDVAKKLKKLYPENHRDTGAKILSIIQNTEKPIIISNAVDFSQDPTFCEWAYIIDLDEGILEVYTGYSITPDTPHENKFEQFGNNPVIFVAAFDISNLPDVEEFVKVVLDVVNSDE